ncbi:MAG TPA: RHS repeat-associated core domain-containing protein [Xanthomonadaceae bacterium]
MFKRLVASLVLLACPLLAHAAGVAPYEEYATHLRAAQEVTPLTSSEFGDQVSLYNGSTEFDVVDIDIPGNNALPVQLRRRFEVSDRRQAGGHLGGFGEWDLDIPYIEGVFSQQYGWLVNTQNLTDRCSNPAEPYTGAPGSSGWVSPDIIWDGYQMHMPGKAYEDLLVSSQPQLPSVSDGKSYPWITKDFTRLTCLSSVQNGSGEGFEAVSPDGIRTDFTWFVTRNYPSVLVDITNVPDWFGGGTQNGNRIYASRSKVFLLASRQQDRFGNWVDYNWTTDASGNTVLASITSSDGRTITPQYNANGSITSATSNLGKWTYGYVSTTTSAVYPGGLSLNTMVRPDQSAWTYTATGSLSSKPLPPSEPHDWTPPANHCQLDPLEIPVGTFTYSATSPFGATATYQFNVERHSHTFIPKNCEDGNPDHQYPIIFDFFDSYTLDSKQVTGPGVALPLSWKYQYGGYLGGAQYMDATVSGYDTPWASQTYVPQGTCSNCKLTQQVIVTSPTDVTRYTFGVAYAINEGRLLATEVDSPDGNTVLRTTTNTFVADSDVPNLPFPSYPGTSLSSSYKNPSANWTRPQSQTAIVQDGVTFTNQVNTWDVLARPTSVTRSSTLGYAKTENTLYADNTTKWVMGQVASVTDGSSNQVITQNTYDPQTAMPATTASFGLLQKSFTYHPADGSDQAGTLATVSDGLGQPTALSGWTRGVPQTVTYADGKTEQTAVNDAGWITSLTDENGYATGYQYDAMGRVKEVDYPSGDAVAWTPTKSTFAKVNSAEYGLLAGHWKRTVTTGASKKTTFYDAMLRPVLQREEDTGNAATIRYTEQAFDAANRNAFAAYPIASVTNYNDALTGTHTSYDALGRITSSAQDSELGSAPLTTSYAYLPHFLTQVTNPRGYSTTTAYQTFDTPDTSQPVSIVSPESVSTNIARDVYGKPLTITRSGFANGLPISETRSFVYDGNQRLCKRVEPETGANLIAYDAANNVNWTESGSTLTSTSSCDNVALPVDAVTRTYDHRNRLLTETVPGSTPIAWSYYPDGALQTLTSGSGTSANVWSYTYNMRRMPVTEQLAIDGRIETVTHAYNVLGIETGLTYPSGFALSFAPNALGQPTKAAASATGVTYFPNGGMSGFTYGNGIVHTLTQNARELPLRSLDLAPSGSAILDDTYAYDANANVASITDGTTNSANTRAMAYDGLDRLTQTQAPNQWWISATTSYDGLDNILTNQVGNVPSYLSTYTYDPATWRLSTVSGYHTMALTYGQRGNLRSRGSGQDSYTFDGINRMLSVDGKESYVYDGYGRRVKVTRTSDGKTDYPVYDMSGRLITEDDQRSNKTIDYLNLNGSLVSKRVATLGNTTYTVTYEHTDALHSPTYETNAAGALTRAERYTPYGEPSDRTYSQGPGFTGHVTDVATGLTYAQQRYYDPVIGRFLSTDPVQADDKGGSFNRYWYADDNPYGFTDPDGRDSYLVSRPAYKFEKHTFVVVANKPGGNIKADFHYGPSGPPGKTLTSGTKLVSLTGTNTETALTDAKAFQALSDPAAASKAGITMTKINATDDSVIAAGNAVDKALGTLDHPGDMQYWPTPSSGNFMEANSNSAAAAVVDMAQKASGNPQTGHSNPAVGSDSAQHVKNFVPAKPCGTSDCSN